MHTHAFACFPCLCVWDQTSLAMGRREGPRYMFHFVHLPPPFMLGHCRMLSKCCWDLLKSHMVKRMAMNFSSGCWWALLCIHMLLRWSHSTSWLWLWYINEILYGKTGTTWTLKRGCVIFYRSECSNMLIVVLTLKLYFSRWFCCTVDSLKVLKYCWTQPVVRVHSNNYSD